MSDRKIRGLEDREAQERKALLRDVRSPVHQVVDALKNGTVQTSGTFGAGVCLFAFSRGGNAALCAGAALFCAALCVRKQRAASLPNASGPLRQGQRRPPARQARLCQAGRAVLPGNALNGKELWLKAKDILTHMLLFGTTAPARRKHWFRWPIIPCHRQRAFLHRPQGLAQVGCKFGRWRGFWGATMTSGCSTTEQAAKEGQVAAPPLQYQQSFHLRQCRSPQ